MSSARRAAGVGASGLQASAWAGIFVFGIVMAVLGAVLPSLVERVGFGSAAAGDLFLAMNSAMLVMTVLFGPLVDRFGFKAFLTTSALLVAAAFLLLAGASTYTTVLAAALVLGLGGGGLNGGTNALTSDLHEGAERGAALNILGIFFGFGALSIPFVIGTLLKTLGLRTILQAAGLLSLVPLAVFAALRFPKAKQARGFPLKDAAAVVRDSLLWLAALILFFQSGNEFTAGGWISTYLQGTFGLGSGPASLLLAGYWAAIMAGRLFASRLSGSVRGGTLILGSALVSLAAAITLAAAPSGGTAGAAAVILGLGFAAIYPTTLALVGGRFAALSGTAFSVVIAVGLVGGMLAPWLAGRIAEASSLRQALLIPVFNCAMIVVLASLVRRGRGQ